jgi:hypothetical protein
MTPSATMLDAVDRGFLRWLAERPPLRASVADAAPVAAADRSPPATTVAAATPPLPEVWQPPDPGPSAPLVDRLLHAAPRSWETIARRVEDAHRDGAGVVAVAGGRRGEGRTTVVECLARTLAARGRRVEIVDTATAAAALSGGRDGGAIVLVDAGVWFPGGPIRRAHVERVSLGCDAVILVRREGQPQCAARGTAIEAAGLRLLGEVLTMVPVADAAGPAPDAGGTRR